MSAQDTLAKRLTELLAELRITPSTMTQNLGRKYNYVSNILNGSNKNPGNEIYDYLQVRYNANPAWLKYGEGDMFLEGGKQDNYSNASLVKLLNTLSPDTKKSVRDYIEALAIREKYLAGELVNKENTDD